MHLDPPARPIIRVQELGRRGYAEILRAMREHTELRVAGGNDELWLVEHPAVFTLGRAGRPEHILDPGEIPVVQSDRGGQVTYHGPGQVILYTMLELKAHGLTVRSLVHVLEEVVVRYLAEHHVTASRRRGAPGVYVEGRKIAALGLRIRRGCSYHGLSFNVAMDLSPFRRIDPCGYPGLEVTQLADVNVHVTPQVAGRRLAALCIEMVREFGEPKYNAVSPHPAPDRLPTK